MIEFFENSALPFLRLILAPSNLYYLYASVVLFILGLRLALKKLESDDKSEKEIGRRIALSCLFFAIMISVWIAAFEGLESSNSRMNKLAIVSICYTAFYIIGHWKGFLDTQVSSDALSVLDFSIIAAWVHEAVSYYSSVETGFNPAVLMAAFYGLPIGFITFRVNKMLTSGDAYEARNAISMGSVSAVALIGTFLIEFHDDASAWYQILEVHNWTFFVTVFLVSAIIWFFMFLGNK